ncbi:MAG: hypothetical protein NZO16_00110 [Deltaproteobacteria bacterium]|nr:hypothetical protein [Deltaproteobacteria bacterium]
MNFGNPFFLLLLPLIVFVYWLIYRKSDNLRPVEFSGYIFLSKIQRQTIRGFPWKAFLDFLPAAFMTLGLSVPFLTSEYVTILIDNSASAGFQLRPQTIVFDELKKKADQIVRDSDSVTIVDVCSMTENKMNTKEEAIKFIDELEIKNCEDQLSSAHFYYRGSLHVLSDQKVTCDDCSVYTVRPADTRNVALVNVDFDGEILKMDILCNYRVNGQIEIKLLERIIERNFSCESSVSIEERIQERPIEVRLKTGGNNSFDDVMSLNPSTNVYFENQAFQFLTRVYEFNTDPAIKILKWNSIVHPNSIIYVETNEKEDTKKGRFMISDLYLRLFLRSSQVEVRYVDSNLASESKSVALGFLDNGEKGVYVPSSRTILLPFDLAGSLENPEVKILLLNLISWLSTNIKNQAFYASESFPSYRTVELQATRLRDDASVPFFEFFFKLAIYCGIFFVVITLVRR